MMMVVVAAVVMMMMVAVVVMMMMMMIVVVAVVMMMMTTTTLVVMMTTTPTIKMVVMMMIMKMMRIIIMIVQTVTILSSQTTAARVLEGDIAALNGHLHIIDGVSADLVTVSPLITLTMVTSQTGETAVTDIYTKWYSPDEDSATLPTVLLPVGLWAERRQIIMG